MSYTEKLLIKELFGNHFNPKLNITKCPFCSNNMYISTISGNYWFYCPQHFGNIYSLLNYIGKHNRFKEEIPTYLKIQHNKQQKANLLKEIAVPKTKIDINFLPKYLQDIIDKFFIKNMCWESFKNSPYILFIDSFPESFSTFGSYFRGRCIVFIHEFLPGYISGLTVYSNKGVATVRFDEYNIGVTNFQDLQQTEHGIICSSPLIAAIYNTLLSTIDRRIKIGATYKKFIKFSDIAEAIDKENHCFWVFNIKDSIIKLAMAFDMELFVAPKIIDIKELLEIYENKYNFDTFMEFGEKKFVTKISFEKFIDRLNLTDFQKIYLNIKYKIVKDVGHRKIIDAGGSRVIYDPLQGVYAEDTGKTIISQPIIIESIVKYGNNKSEYIFVLRHKNNVRKIAISTKIQPRVLWKTLKKAYNLLFGESLFINNRYFKNLIDIILACHKPTIINLSDVHFNKDILILPGVIYKANSVPLPNNIIGRIEITKIQQKYKNCTTLDYQIAKKIYKSITNKTKFLLLKYFMLIVYNYKERKKYRYTVTGDILKARQFCDAIGLPLIFDVSIRDKLENLVGAISLPLIVFENDTNKTDRKKLLVEYFGKNMLFVKDVNKNTEPDFEIKDIKILLNVMIDYFYKNVKSPKNVKEVTKSLINLLNS